MHASPLTLSAIPQQTFPDRRVGQTNARPARKAIENLSRKAVS